MTTGAQRDKGLQTEFPMTRHVGETCLSWPMIALGFVSACATAPMNQSPAGEPQVVTEDYRIASTTQGNELFIRNKRPAAMTAFSPEKTILYVHGATSASEATFDLPLEGISWMDYLARRGYDVFLVDVRGYGRSSHPAEMEQPAESNPPIATTDVAVEDVGSAVDHILAKRGVPTLTLLGWSWGCSIVGGYTAQHGTKVNRLVLYAPQWVRKDAAAPAGQPMGAYVTWTPAAGRARIQAGAPEGRSDDLLPPASFQAWSAAVLDTDPVGAKRNPPVVRTPNGVYFDNARYWQAGKPFYDPSKITVPTLIVRGEWDGVLPSYMSQELFQKLTNVRYKRLIEIGAATHFMFLEKNRMQLFQEVQLFLDEPIR